MTDNGGDNVVTFRGNSKSKEPQESEELILVCNNCNCQSFNLMNIGGKGAIQCCNCLNFLSDDLDDAAEQGWRRVASNAPEEPSEVPLAADTTTVKELGDVDFASHQPILKAKRWREEGTLAIVVAYDKDSVGSMWFNITTDEQREWCLRKMEGLIKHLKELKVAE